MPNDKRNTEQPGVEMPAPDGSVIKFEGRSCSRLRGRRGICLPHLLEPQPDTAKRRPRCSGIDGASRVG